MFNQEVQITTVIGLLVITAAVSAIVSNFIKEKLFTRLVEENSREGSGRGEKICPYHYQMSERIESSLKAFDRIVADIKAMQTLYYELDKKINVFIARDEEKFKGIRECVAMMSAAIQKLEYDNETADERKRRTTT